MISMLCSDRTRFASLAATCRDALTDDGDDAPFSFSRAESHCNIEGNESTSSEGTEYGADGDANGTHRSLTMESVMQWQH